MKDAYEIAVVGGGIAGLAAAYELREHDVVLVEAEAQLGGRVATREKEGLPYELGAILAYNKRMIPFAVQGTEFATSSDQPRLVPVRGPWIEGPDVTSCLQQASTSSRYTRDLASIEEKLSTSEEIDDDLYANLNAFFQLIYPFELRLGTTRVKQSALRSYRGGRYQRGNRELVETLAEAANSDLRLGTLVEDICREADGSLVLRCKHGSLRSNLNCQKVIITIPGSPALSLVPQPNESSKSFFKSLEFGDGLVVAIGARRESSHDLPFAVLAKGPVVAFMQRRYVGKQGSVYTFYYVGDHATRRRQEPRSVLVRECLKALEQAGLEPLDESEIAFSDHHYWPRVGPVISSETYDKLDSQVLNPSPGCFLGGDYLCQQGSPVPFGMIAAFRSGIHAARLLLESS